MESIEKHESIDDVMFEDVTGPGSEIKIKQEARQGGARISKNSKKIVFVVIGGLGVAILGGVLAAGGGGSKSRTAESSVSTEADSVGRAQPPAPPQHFAIASYSPLASPASDTSGTPVENASAVSKTGPLSSQSKLSGTAATGGQRELSPKEKYKAWLVDQHYKKLEGNQLSADSANESGFGDASMSHAAVAQSSPSTASSNQAAIDEIHAMEAKGLSTAGVDPALLALAHAQAAGAGAGGQASDQDKNKSFLADNRKSDDGYLHAQIEDALGKHELLAGSVIPAVLLTALDSDLPGFVTAQVRQTVYDSLDHHAVLIPQGAKLVGQYSSDVSYGQSRALIAWSRLIFPDGKMIDLQGMAGTDGQGQAGFSDQVDNHYAKIFGSSILMSLLGAAAQLSQPQSGLQTMQPTPQQQAAAAMASGMANTGNQLLSKNLSVQPTIKIRAGYLFNVMVNKTMIMPVWSGE